MTKLSLIFIINNHHHYSNKFPEEGNQYRAIFCFLEGLSTINRGGI